jgi:ubiquinone/menaquinone biosynthesis C-methylase UbiE
MITFKKGGLEDRILELGGGANRNPISDVNCDVRPGPGVDFTADFESPLPIKDEDFSGVIAQFVIEHLCWRKVKLFISEIHRVLKPQGKVCIVTANTLAQFEFLSQNPQGWDGQDFFDSASCIIFGGSDYPENTHKNFMSPEIITKLFSDAGFIDIEVKPFGARSTDLVMVATKKPHHLIPGLAEKAK